VLREFIEGALRVNYTFGVSHRRRRRKKHARRQEAISRYRVGIKILPANVINAGAITVSRDVGRDGALDRATKQLGEQFRRSVERKRKAKHGNALTEMVVGHREGASKARG